MKTKVSKDQVATMEADAIKNRTTKPEDLAAIINLSREMWKLREKIKFEEFSLENLKKRYQQMEETILPEKMTSAGLSEFKLENGWEITIEPFIHASIPSAGSIEKATGPDRVALERQRDNAFAWLRSNKAGSLIKSKLTAEFGKGHAKDAKKYFKMIEKAGYSGKCEESVHPQTLNSFIRDCVKEGTEIPSDVFNLHIGKRAELKAPKGSK